MKRREFVVRGAAVATGLTLATPTLVDLLSPAATHGGGLGKSGVDPHFRDLALRAIDAADRAGASYVDVRITRNRSESVITREARVTGLSDEETFGFGVRVLVAGTWGFSASPHLDAEEMERMARRAVEQARANTAGRRIPVELTVEDIHSEGTWRSPIEIDPFNVPIQEKIELLLAANEAALGVSGTRFVNSSMSFLREEKFFASSEGTFTDQVIYRTDADLTVVAVSADGSDFQSRRATEIPPCGLGYEYVLEADLVGHSPEWAEQAVQKLSARSVEPGLYDLVLLPSHLWLTIHESIAHPTEMDRVMGLEADFAGTSFISPPEDFLGKFRYGPEFMNVQGERSAKGSLATCGYDDEGVVPRDYLIVKDGLLRDLQTTREEAMWLRDWYEQIGEPVRSHGNSYASSWDRVQFQRMPNVNLLPHPDRDVTLDELVEGVERGILIDGHGSFSIDQQRYNAQFGGQVFWEIRDGRIQGMLKDVAYQIRTPEFWNSMDLIGGRSSYFVSGTPGDGKGQPMQLNAVSHGSVPTRHRGVTVINTGRAV
jgi:TldD protein